MPGFLGQLPEALTESYQCTNLAYENLMQEYNKRVAKPLLGLEPVEYQVRIKTFANFEVNGLNNGLSDEENLVLLRNINTEEAIRLIMTGLANLAGIGHKFEDA